MDSHRKNRIVVFFPAFNGGGAEAVAVWMLQTLHTDYDVTLFSLTDNRLTELDRMYGTRLAISDIKTAGPIPGIVAVALRFILFRVAELPVLRQHLLMRYSRRFHKRIDLAISASNEMEFGEPGIQYIHDAPRWATGRYWARRLFGYSEMAMRSNLCLVPSVWMKKKYKRVYGSSAQIIPPPVRSEFPRLDWGKRDDEFLCVARLAPAKRVEDAIEILRRVRKKGYPVRLRILASGGKWLYELKIRIIAKRYSSWVTLEQNVSDERYRLLLSSHRYGINTAFQEGFGISIAEMVNAGCIPFVRGKGGQSEIFEDCEPLRFNGLNEGVERITAMIDNHRLQMETLWRLKRQRGQFSCERFMREIQDVVRKQLKSSTYSKQISAKKAASTAALSRAPHP